MLSSDDIQKQFAETFALVEIDFRYRRGVDRDEPRPEVSRYNPKQYRPVIVILDANGKKVLKLNGGFNNQTEARLLADFVRDKHYLTSSWSSYRTENFK